jgi:hypothetical protein
MGQAAGGVLDLAIQDSIPRRGAHQFVPINTGITENTGFQGEGVRLRARLSGAYDSFYRSLFREESRSRLHGCSGFEGVDAPPPSQVIS